MRSSCARITVGSAVHPLTGIANAAHEHIRGPTALLHFQHSVGGYCAAWRFRFLCGMLLPSCRKYVTFRTTAFGVLPIYFAIFAISVFVTSRSSVLTCSGVQVVRSSFLKDTAHPRSRRMDSLFSMDEGDRSKREESSSSVISGACAFSHSTSASVHFLLFGRISSPRYAHRTPVLRGLPYRGRR